MTWEDYVPCSSDPEAWFGYDADGGRRNPDQEDAITHAKLLCVHNCPLLARRRCARAALEGEEKYGIWAGVELVIHKSSARARRKKLSEAREELRMIAGGEYSGVASSA